jgi:hypothetical protein
MHEYILTAILWGDEAVALTVVEPLHCFCNHGNTSVWLNWNDAKPDPEGDIAGVTKLFSKPPALPVRLEKALPFLR